MVVDLADILRRHWPRYEQQYGSRLLPSHRRLVSAILQCRTSALGGHLYACAPCSVHHYAYHSCNHRSCPKCGHHEATAWIDQQQAYLLPVPYALVTFTLPAQLRLFCRSAQKFWYHQLFCQSAATLQDVAARPKYLGGRLGFLGILQTWTRDLRYHPHVHYLVPTGGLSPDGHHWRRPPNPKFFLPERVLSARFRSRFKRLLRQHHPSLFQRIPARVWKLQWVVDVELVGSGQAALQYLSAYIYKTAITSQRLLACDSQTVTFRYREAKTQRGKEARLPAEQFLHRWLQHTLPRGFQRVRYYGWRSPATAQRWQRILALLHWKAPVPLAPSPQPPPCCPRCHQPMTRLRPLPRAPPPSS